MVTALKQTNSGLTERLEALTTAMESLKATANESSEMAAETAANLEARLAESQKQTERTAEGLAKQQEECARIDSLLATVTGGLPSARNATVRVRVRARVSANPVLEPEP